MDRRQPCRRSACDILFVAGAPLLVLLAAGCAMNFPFARNEFGPSLPQNAGAKEVVDRVNANIERIQSWRADGVRISGSAMVMHLSGHLAVERPRNFRLTAGTLLTEEADFGSNADWFWFWVKRGQPNYVFRARHDDIGRSDVLRQIPFQPDWLMEAFGVVPIDPEQVTLQAGEPRHTINLVSERLTPSGQPVKKVVLVDTARGVIIGHHLYDPRGNLIAKATLDKHEFDKAKGVALPHLIVLEWPQAQMQIKLEIGQIEINSTSIPPRMWEVPNKQPYYRSVELGAASRGPLHREAPPVAPRARPGAPAAGEGGGNLSNTGRARLDDSTFGSGSEKQSAEAVNTPAWSTPIESTESPRGAASTNNSFEAVPTDSGKRHERPKMPPDDPFSTDF